MSEKEDKTLRELEHIEITLRLNDDVLYDPSQVAETAANPLEDPEKYDRLRKNFGKRSQRHGDLPCKPDNAVKNPETGLPEKVLIGKGTPEEKWAINFWPGEDHSRWFGCTWKEKIPKERLKTFFRWRRHTEQQLFQVFQSILDKKKKEQKRRRWKLILIAAIGTMIIFLALLGISHENQPAVLTQKERVKTLQAEVFLESDHEIKHKEEANPLPVQGAIFDYYLDEPSEPTPRVPQRRRLPFAAFEQEKPPKRHLFAFEGTPNLLFEKISWYD